MGKKEIDFEGFTKLVKGEYLESLSDKELREKFDEIDTDKSGKLDEEEVAAALTQLNFDAKEIEKITLSMGKQEIDFEGFKKLAKGEYLESLSDEQLREKFDEIDSDKSGKLD